MFMRMRSEPVTDFIRRLFRIALYQYTMSKLTILEQLKQHKKLLITVNILFAALAISGQVGQNVTLPLWSSAATTSCQQSTGAQNESANHTSNNSTGGNGGPSMDPFFVVSSASFAFVVIFGALTLVSALFGAVTVDDLRFPQWQLFLIGFFDALNGILVVYSSPSSRTAPFLQAILGNFLIPSTILFRSDTLNVDLVVLSCATLLCQIDLAT